MEERLLGMLGRVRLRDTDELCRYALAERELGTHCDGAIPGAIVFSGRRIFGSRRRKNKRLASWQSKSHEDAMLAVVGRVKRRTMHGSCSALAAERRG